jgi:phosphopantothenoylcysteine decarboxylase/phosphopantothenate--cysteine ligase
MTAAVADWRPANPTELKQTKSQMSDALQLTRNPDILAKLGELYGPGKAHGPLVVGFAAESHDVEQRAREKFYRKNAHVMIANQIGGASSAFAADSSSASILRHDRDHIERLPHAPKLQLARSIWAAILPVWSDHLRHVAQEPTP